MMAIAISHNVPASAGVVLEQFKYLWTTFKVWILALVPLLCVTVAEPISQFFLLFISGGWAILIWDNERPHQRVYQWTMPVHRSQLQLARIAAGLAWLLLGLTVIAGIQLLLSVLFSLPTREWMFSLPAWLYLAIPLGLTNAYLLCSALSLVSRYPMRWVLGGILGLFLPVFFDHDFFFRMFDSLSFGSMGWRPALLPASEYLSNGSAAQSGIMLTVVVWLIFSFAILVLASFHRRDT